jgi:hypothetical protein
MDQAHRYEQLGQVAGQYHYDPSWAAASHPSDDVHGHLTPPLPSTYRYHGDQPPQFPQSANPYTQLKRSDYEEHSQSGQESNLPSPSITPTRPFPHITDHSSSYPPLLHPKAQLPKRDSASPPIVILPHDDPNVPGKKMNFDLRNPLPFSNRKVRDKIDNSNSNFTAIHFPPLNAKNKTYKQ